MKQHLFFLHKGASKVYALEPVKKYYHYLEKNVRRNKVEDKVIPVNMGVWFQDGILAVPLIGYQTGLKTEGYRDVLVEFKVKRLDQVLGLIYEKTNRIDLVKMNCEGCEYVLLALNDVILSLPKRYLIQVHGSELPIIEAMKRLGYKGESVIRIKDLISVWLFERIR